MTEIITIYPTIGVTVLGISVSLPVIPLPWTMVDGQVDLGMTSSALDFATPPPVTISGYVRDGSGAGVSGAVMNGLPGPPSTDGSGYYSASVSWGWSGTVTPSKSGWTFSPTSRSYSNVSSNQTGQNYTGTPPPVAISGYVRTNSGSGISGVAMSGLPGTPSTDGSGYYSASVNWSWSGTVTPSKSGWTFSPTSRPYSNVTSNQTGQDYTGTPPPVTISGAVGDSSGAGVSGVVMNGLPGTPSTDGGGNYSAIVSWGWSGTVTPSKSGWTFSPTSRSYSNVTSSQTGQDYTGMPLGRAVCAMSGYYTPGAAQAISIAVEPELGVSSYAVEDAPPTGWTVTSISHPGAWDSTNKKVKWFFTDGTARTLTYSVTPPLDETGVKTFAGIVSFDGTSEPITGDRESHPGTFHPADTTSANWRIDINELTGYAAAWKTGAPWVLPPNPIPIDYVTRAGAIWKSGEVYHYEGGQSPPACWVSGAASVSMPRGAVKALLTSASATRDLPYRYTADVPLSVAIAADPGLGASSYALEDAPPTGCAVTSISHPGAWDSVNGKVKWFFTDNTPRTLTYTATPPAGESGVRSFAGLISIDGSSTSIGGDSEIADNTAPTLAGIPDVATDEDTPSVHAIDLWAHADDADTPDSGLTFTITGTTNASAGVTIDANRYININPASNWNGTAAVTVEVSDGRLTASDSFVVTVNAVNDPPVFAAIPDVTTPENAPINNARDLRTYASDVETADSGLTFTVVSVVPPQAGVTLDSNRYIDVNPATNWNGTSVVTVEVSDGSATDSQTFDVVVTPVNQPPVITHTPVTAGYAGTPIVIDATISDPDNTPTANLYYRTGGIGAYTAVAMTHLGSGSYIATIPGSAVTTAGVQYYIGASDSSTSDTEGPFSVIVSPAPDTAAPGAPQITYVGRSLSLDGDSNGWFSANPLSAAQQERVIDLGALKTVCGLTCSVADPAYFADGARYFPRDFRVLGSANGIDWTPLSEAKGLAPRASRLYLWQFKPTECRYLKVCATPVKDASGYHVYMGLGDIHTGARVEQVVLRWTAPADDGYVAASGSASQYDLRYGTPGQPVEDWTRISLPAPKAPGQPEEVQFTVNLAYPVTIRLTAADEVPNWSSPSEQAWGPAFGYVCTAPVTDNSLDVDQIPAFTFSQNGVGSTYIELSTLHSFPTRPAKATDGTSEKTLRFPVKAGSTQWVPSYAQWKAIRRIVAPDGVLNWRLVGKTDALAGVYGPPQKASFDVGAWQVGDLDLRAPSPTLQWTHSADDMPWYRLQFSVNADFSGTARVTVLIPARTVEETAYTFSAREVARLRALAAANDVSALYYRVRALDENKAFMTWSPTKQTTGL
jgi:hypothetical protein